MSNEVWIPRDSLDLFVKDSYSTTENPGEGQGQGSGVIIRGEEVGIVLLVLILWVAAIILFFNRWGKIRMLEPYQPKFCEHHQPTCPMAEVHPLNPSYPRTFSKFNLSSEAGPSPHFSKCNYHGVIQSNAVTVNNSSMDQPLISAHSQGHGGSRSMSVSMGGLGSGPYPYPYPGGNSSRGANRMRQNSVFVTTPTNLPPSIFGDSVSMGSSRKTKSAVDLSTLVLCNEFMENVRRNSKNSITNL